MAEIIKTQNTYGVVKSKGFEFISKLETFENLNFGVNFDYTSTYDEQNKLCKL